ncbi:PolC-type DNA polymerase III [Spiroplasma endosymbiont of Danaus chrysippus]|uniref:PolC-type DNA polymerase III n=1 Tax=Spiroplasma endosymbiont of Danaus chrysippus TaxID=2691041 RepID=UPI0013CAB855|nr:PolC-type DNA polymerase III [Spiroplasma endosymbiont of Danaus chrysippus]CAB1054674.1 DNA polymerase III alpha subunit (EC 2.7.7.7) [Spiroplasma endosymbiont of Danaus chrysippus]
MNQDLQKLFHEMDFNDVNNEFNHATIKKVQYFHHNQQVIITINLPNFLTTTTLKSFEQHFEKLPVSNISVDFNVSLTADESTVLTYFHYIKTHKLQLLAGIYYSLPDSAINYKNNIITITIHNSIEEKLITNEFLQFINYFQQYGFKKIQLKTKINKAEQPFISYENESKAEISKITNNLKTKIPNNNISKNFNTTTYRKKAKVNLEITDPTHSIKDIIGDEPNIIISGKVFKINKFLTKTQKWFYSFWITDYSDAITCKAFINSDQPDQKFDNIKVDDWIKINANSRYDNYSKEQVLWIDDLIIDLNNKNTNNNDDAKTKRIEFHTHTKMSAMDGITSASDYINQVAKWGHQAIGFTDHLNVQAYPDIANAAKKHPNLKVMYGIEMDLIPNNISITKNNINTPLLDLEYIVLDLETTGLSTNYHEIIEFGYTIVKDNMILKQDTILIKPNNPVPEHITELTSITNVMLKDKQTLQQILPTIIEIIGNKTIVAHNANFDFGFLQAAMKQLGFMPLNNPVIDTLQLSRAILPQLKYYRLGTICRTYGIKYDDEIAHRADYDANVLAQVFLKMLQQLKTEFNCCNLQEINNLINEQINFKLRGEHITIFAKNQLGLKDLYQLVSLSHTKYFYKTPKIISEAINENRKELLIGSSCINGAVFETALNKSEEELIKIMKWFDFIEIQPPAVYKHLIQLGNITKEQLDDTIKKIINNALKLNKLVIATSDAHYLHPHEKMYRDVIINSKAIGGLLHPLFDRKGKVASYPDQHLRTTNQMLTEFNFLDDPNLINDIVINNPLQLAKQFEMIKPIKDGLFTPSIVNVDTKLRNLCYEQAWNRYGNPLPTYVEKRLTRELDAIITHGFAVVYWIAHKLVEKSLQDGYLVGSRGSVGSSLVATFANITEVNPLQPHYLCPQCKTSEFISNGSYKCGYDLPKKICSQCNIDLITDGHDIPFETFLGFDGDKTPDIDLNFSGEYQNKAHDFTKEMFGEENVFRAGTISTIANKTAYGYVKAYAEKIGQSDMRAAKLELLSQGCVGIKRTTGQHPGGIIVVPKEYNINDFTPINFPADDTSSTWKTTHFDFNAIHDNLLKLDILGHVDPTALKMLENLTGIDPKTIPNQDEKVLSLFSNLSALNITSDDLLGEKTGAIGIPEFGTGFVRKMLSDTLPTSFSELVQISGLSHGTDVWLNNADELISQQGLKLKDVIGCRDDIMTYLVYQGLPAKIAFNIMEDVRKGKGIKQEYEKLMQEKKVPNWYIQSCKKIKYMFPKAHATAYVLMAWRVAWFKVYYPHEYYVTYFTTRCEIFDIKTMLQGIGAITNKLKDINNRLRKNDGQKNTVTTKEKDLIPLLEVALEMNARNIKFSNISLEHSDAKLFQVKIINGEKQILPPFITLDGLGEIVANSIVKARSEQAITSKNDLQLRTNITKTNYQLLNELGVLEHLEENTQLMLEL